MNYCLNSNNQTLKPHSNPPPSLSSFTTGLLFICQSCDPLRDSLPASPSAPSSLHSGLSRLIVS